MTESPLKEKGIVITRPLNQAESFAQLIHNVEGQPIYFPLIEITAILNEHMQHQLTKLSNYDSLVFVSSNAVKHLLKHIHINDLQDKTLITTGKKTENILIELGLSVDFCPEKHFNSEALLAIDTFTKHVKGKKIAIVRGSNGRDYLKDQLIRLGAHVDYIDVYSRHCPQQNLNHLKTAWKDGKLDVVLLTSASSTANFFKLAKNEEWIHQVTVLIGSPRMRSNIPAHFKGNIIIAEDPSDETIFNTLEQSIPRKN